ncbi:hypothetical protein KAR91_78100 [Candidatus Pacearchaeota archaeon]|nr:hypothetical protein [Candidatus Pacearchaeota archaeon]
MSDFISKFFNAEPIIPTKFQAPSGFIYEVDGILLTNVTSANINVMVIPFQTEAIGALALANRNFIFMGNLQIAGSFNYMPLEKPVRTRYLSIVSDSGGNASCGVVIFYRLVKATMAERIWEFVRRGKNP